MDFSTPSLIRQANRAVAATPLETISSSNNKPPTNVVVGGGGSTGSSASTSRAPLPPPPSIKKMTTTSSSIITPLLLLSSSSDNDAFAARPQPQPQHDAVQQQNTTTQIMMEQRMERLLTRMEEHLASSSSSNALGDTTTNNNNNNNNNNNTTINNDQFQLLERRCENLEIKCRAILAKVEHMGSSMDALGESSAFLIGRLDGCERLVEERCGEIVVKVGALEGKVMEAVGSIETERSYSSSAAVKLMETIVETKFQTLEGRILEALTTTRTTEEDTSEYTARNGHGGRMGGAVDANTAPPPLLACNDDAPSTAMGQPSSTTTTTSMLCANGIGKKPTMIDPLIEIAAKESIDAAAVFSSFGATAATTTTTAAEEDAYYPNSNGGRLLPSTPNAGFYTPSATPSAAAAFGSAAATFGSTTTTPGTIGSASNFFGATPSSEGKKGLFHDSAEASALAGGAVVAPAETFSNTAASEPFGSSPDRSSPAGIAAAVETTEEEDALGSSMPAAAANNAKGSDAASDAGADPNAAANALFFGSSASTTTTAADLFGTSPSPMANNLVATAAETKKRPAITPPPTTMGTLNLLAQNNDYFAAVPLARGIIARMEEDEATNAKKAAMEDDDAQGDGAQPLAEPLAEAPMAEQPLAGRMLVVSTEDDEKDAGVGTIKGTVESEAVENDDDGAPTADAGPEGEREDQLHVQEFVDEAENEASSIRTEDSVRTEASFPVEPASTTATRNNEVGKVCTAAANNNNNADTYLSFVSLPPGWVEAVDAGSGKIYYFNEVTGVSSWERPLTKEEEEAAVVAAAAAAAENEAADENDVSADCVVADEALDDAAANNENAHVPLEKSASEQIGADEPPAVVVENEEMAEEPPLPAGWIGAVDPGSGMTYFYDESTGTSSWERPVAMAMAMMEGNAADDRAENEDESCAEEDVEPVSREESESNNGWTHDVDGAEAPAVSPDADREDDVFVEEDDAAEGDDGLWAASGPDAEPSSEPLATAAKPSTAEGDAAASYFDDGAAASLAVEREEHSKDAMVDVAAAEQEPVANESTELVPVILSLPEGWIEAIDPGSGMTYFCNQTTGESSWDRPVMDQDSAGIVDPPVSTDNGIDGTAYENIMAAEETAEGETSAAHLNEEPLGAELDEGTGEAPVIEYEIDNLLDKTVDAEEDDPDNQDTSSEGETNENNDADTSSAQTPEELGQDDGTPSSTSLPEGWMEATEPSSGMVYYCNQATGVTQWDRPAEEIVATDADGPPQCQEEALPEGWVEATDPSSGGNVYYVNIMTGQSSWERPVSEVDIPEQHHDAVAGGQGVGDALANPDAGAAAVTTVNEPPQSQHDANALPEGWVEALDSGSGRSYFCNAMLGETTWDRPQH